MKRRKKEKKVSAVKTPHQVPTQTINLLISNDDIEL